VGVRGRSRRWRWALSPIISACCIQVPCSSQLAQLVAAAVRRGQGSGIPMVCGLRSEPASRPAPSTQLRASCASSWGVGRGQMERAESGEWRWGGCRPVSYGRLAAWALLLSNKRPCRLTACEVESLCVPTMSMLGCRVSRNRHRHATSHFPQFSGLFRSGSRSGSGRTAAAAAPRIIYVHSEQRAASSPRPLSALRGRPPPVPRPPSPGTPPWSLEAPWSWSRPGGC
jgi:hypothetical protein